MCSIRTMSWYYMMKVVLMCAPSGQCQVLHDEGSLNVCSIRTMSGIHMMKVVLMCAPSGQCQVLHDEGAHIVLMCAHQTLS